MAFFCSNRVWSVAAKIDGFYGKGSVQLRFQPEASSPAPSLLLGGRHLGNCVEAVNLLLIGPTTNGRIMFRKETTSLGLQKIQKMFFKKKKTTKPFVLCTSGLEVLVEKAGIQAQFPEL